MSNKSYMSYWPADEEADELWSADDWPEDGAVGEEDGAEVSDGAESAAGTEVSEDCTTTVASGVPVAAPATWPAEEPESDVELAAEPEVWEVSKVVEAEPAEEALLAELPEGEPLPEEALLAEPAGELKTCGFKDDCEAVSAGWAKATQSNWVSAVMVWLAAMVKPAAVLLMTP